MNYKLTYLIAKRFFDLSLFCDSEMKGHSNFENPFTAISDFIIQNTISRKIELNLRLLENHIDSRILSMISEDDIAIEINGSVSIEIQNQNTITFLSIGETSLSYYTQSGETISNKRDLRNLDSAEISRQIGNLNGFLVKVYLGDFTHKLSKILDISSKLQSENELVYCR